MQNTRKVLMLVENMTVPSDPRVWMEATTLRDAGYHVSVICPKGNTSCKESYSCIDQIHIYRYPLPAIHRKYIEHVVEFSCALFMTFLLSFKVFFRHGFDVIHAANPPDMFFLIGLFYRPFGKKFVFDQHDIAPEMFQVLFGGRVKVLYRLLRRMEMLSYKTAHLVITTNETFRWFAIKRGHCQTDKVVIVRNGPDMQRLDAVELEEPSALPGRRRYLLGYIGVMGKQDGVEHILYALHDLVYKRDRQDVSVVLIGEGSASPKLRELAQKLKLDAYITFTGWLEKKEAFRYLATADIGLQPDPQNGLNEFCTMIKTMEYMALGLPIVSFDLVETRFSAQNAALYAVPNEAEDFANQIETLLYDEMLRHSMGAFGRKRVERALSWEHNRKRLLAAYESLFSGTTAVQLPDEEEAHIQILSATTGHYATVLRSTRPE
ncbi:MAG TPA: glycosyltransferase family 4 protein [Ktedonobacteraceae bacterium]|nr:glycosyltransferase family 4 protein [Ktedonobacteraceae bacterium]